MIDLQYETPTGRARCRKVCPTPGKRAAQDFEVRCRREIEEEATRQREEVTKPEPEMPVFKAFAEEFMKSYVLANNVPSEQRGKRSILDRHLLPRFGEHRLAEIGTREIEEMKADLRPTHKPSSINNVRVVLKKILGYAHETDRLAQVPKSRLMRVPPQPFSLLSFEEFAQLLEGAKADHGLLVALLLAGDAGLRPGEIAGMKWQDINFNLGRLTVMRSLDLGGYKREEKAPKGGRARHVPLTRRLRVERGAAGASAPARTVGPGHRGEGRWTGELRNVEPGDLPAGGRAGLPAGLFGGAGEALALPPALRSAATWP
jgi:integrase